MDYRCEKSTRRGLYSQARTTFDGGGGLFPFGPLRKKSRNVVYARRLTSARTTAAALTHPLLVIYRHKKAPLINGAISYRIRWWWGGLFPFGPLCKKTHNVVSARRLASARTTLVVLIPPHQILEAQKSPVG